MKERPILFSSPMVRAIRDGRKTQTRRVVKWKNPAEGLNLSFSGLDAQLIVDGVATLCSRRGDGAWEDRSDPTGCPYGSPGDHLWVRENGWECPERTPRMMREGADTWALYYYDADGYVGDDAEDLRVWGFKRRPSIHMPRWASRISLEVTTVRVERLQNISEYDAIAEGVEPYAIYGGNVVSWKGASHLVAARETAREAFSDLWQSINGADSWDANPFVWATQFKRIET